MFSKSFIRGLSHINKVNAIVLLLVLFTLSIHIFYWLNHQSSERQNSYSQASLYSTNKITDIEKQYRKRFNLMIDGNAETVKECTLGDCIRI